MIDPQALKEIISKHLHELVERIGPRPTGSPGNRLAGNYLQQQFSSLGWQVETPSFECKTWEADNVRLACQGQTFLAQINPYSPAFEGTLPFVVCESVEALGADLAGRIAVLTGALAQEPYMPKHFPFLSFAEQLRVLDALEAASPAAVIGVGALPLFCDADFPIPSITLAPKDEARLVACRGLDLSLCIESAVVPVTAFNVVASARRGTGKKTVLCAHYDTWFETPGALDNASGVAALLALAQMIDQSSHHIEFVMFNGEDHYAAPGQVNYLAGGVADIEYVINIDGVAAAGRQNSLAYFGEASHFFDRVGAVKQGFPALVEVEPWPQGDHMIFVQQGIPAIALSSAEFELWLNLTHTPLDTLEQVDLGKMAEAVGFIYRLLAS